jgi:hypothetical protein
MSKLSTAVACPHNASLFNFNMTLLIVVTGSAHFGDKKNTDSKGDVINVVGYHLSNGALSPTRWHYQSQV